MYQEKISLPISGLLLSNYKIPVNLVNVVLPSGEAEQLTFTMIIGLLKLMKQKQSRLKDIHL